MARLLHFTHHPTPSGNVADFLTTTERFTAVLDSNDDAINTLVREFPDLQYGRPHPEYRGTYVVAFRPKHVRNSHAVYEIDVEYDQPRPQSGQSSSQPPDANPWAFEPTYERGTIIKREIRDEDFEGNPMQNRADEPLGVEFEIYYETVTITRRRLRRTVLPKHFHGCINQDFVRVQGDSYTRDQLRVIGHTSREQPPARFNEPPWVEEVTTIAINDDGWKIDVLNAGYYEYRRSNPREDEGNDQIKRYPIVNEHGQQTSIPVPLDANGSQFRRLNGDVIQPRDIHHSRLIYLTRYPGKRIPLRRFLA